jgi:hypothetical protein
MLRARPALALRDNVFFPLWVLTASATAVALAATPLGSQLGLSTLPADAWPIIVAFSLLAAGLAGAARRATRLGPRL